MVWLRTMLTVLLLALPAGTAAAYELPNPQALQVLLAMPPATVTVVEPHLSSADKPVRVGYRGWPARTVLGRLFGPGWREAGLEITFRALDGYVSRIPVERFGEFEAHLVFARADGDVFQLDNRLQNEKRVPLAPYYLVWNNVAAPELLSEGASYWPYQVARIELSHGKREALLPGDLADRFAAEAAHLQRECLACHKVNGHGGDKMPIDLVEVVGTMPADAFRTWLLDPRSVMENSTMPALAPGLPAAERQTLADRLHTYLAALAAR